MIAIYHIINVKGHRVYPILTVASLAKFTISTVGFEHSPRFEKFKSQNFREIKMSPFVFRIVTYLPREVKGTVINKIYFF